MAVAVVVIIVMPLFALLIAVKQCNQIEQFLKVLGNQIYGKRSPNDCVTFWAILKTLTLI